MRAGVERAGIVEGQLPLERKHTRAPAPQPIQEPAVGGCLLSGLSALAPDLVSLGVAQTFVRGAAAAGGVLIGIVAAEEMPAGSRAFAFSLLAAAGALGAGLCLFALPLAVVVCRDGGS